MGSGILTPSLPSFWLFSPLMTDFRITDSPEPGVAQHKHAEVLPLIMSFHPIYELAVGDIDTIAVDLHHDEKAVWLHAVLATTQSPPK